MTTVKDRASPPRNQCAIKSILLRLRQDLILWYLVNLLRVFVAIGHFSLVDATARTKVLNFTSNIAALLFFVLAGLPIWELGLVMAVGGFFGARMGAKVVVTSLIRA